MHVPRRRKHIESKESVIGCDGPLFIDGLNRPTAIRCRYPCCRESATCFPYSKLVFVDSTTPPAATILSGLSYLSDATEGTRGIRYALIYASLFMTATNTIQEVGISVWSLDPARSAVHFKVRHMAIAWVRGDFRISKGTLQSDEDRTSEAIDAASVDSGEPKRDEYLRNAEFFDVEHLPTIHFRSTEISRPSAGTAVVGTS